MASKLEKIIVRIIIAIPITFLIYVFLHFAYAGITTYINNPDSFKANKLVNSYTYKQSFEHFDTFEKEIEEIIAPYGFTLELKGEDVYISNPDNSPDTPPPFRYSADRCYTINVSDNDIVNITLSNSRGNESIEISYYITSDDYEKDNFSQTALDIMSAIFEKVCIRRLYVPNIMSIKEYTLTKEEETLRENMYYKNAYILKYDFGSLYFWDSGGLTCKLGKNDNGEYIEHYEVSCYTRYATDFLR